jgi:hypothetical protein
MCLKDSGLDVVVGLRKDGKSWEDAKKNGMKVDEVAKAVKNGCVEGGATWDNSYNINVRKYGQIFRVILYTPPIPNDAWVAGPGVPKEDAETFKKVLLGIKENTRTRDGRLVLDPKLGDPGKGSVGSRKRGREVRREEVPDLVGADRGSRGQLSRSAEEAGQADALRFVQSADDDMLVSLYRSAGAFVYPSRYEGFGLPLLECEEAIDDIKSRRYSGNRFIQGYHQEHEEWYEIHCQALPGVYV